MIFFSYLNASNMQIVRFVLKFSSVLRKACNGYGPPPWSFPGQKTNLADAEVMEYVMKLQSQLTCSYLAGFEFPPSGDYGDTFFWYVTLCSSVEVYRHFVLRLKMEAVNSFETSMDFYLTIQRYNSGITSTDTNLWRDKKFWEELICRSGKLLLVIASTVILGFLPIVLFFSSLLCV
jgi:hypothetical protein